MPVHFPFLAYEIGISWASISDFMGIKSELHPSVFSIDINILLHNELQNHFRTKKTDRLIVVFLNTYRVEKRMAASPSGKTAVRL